MQVVEPAVGGGEARPEACAMVAGAWGCLRRAVGMGSTARAVGGLGLSLLVILIAPSRAAEAAPGEAPRLRARERLALAALALIAGCIARTAGGLG